MDGTLIDSTPGVNGAWEIFRKDYPGIDMDQVLSCTRFSLSQEGKLLLTRARDLSRSRRSHRGQPQDTLRLD